MATHDTSPPTAPDAGEAAVFRAPLASLVAIVFLAMGLSPIAFQGGPWFALFLVPVVLAVWLIRTSTTVDVHGVQVRSLLRTRTVPWERVATLRLVDRGWVRAVTRPAGTAPDGTSSAGTSSPAGREIVLRGVRLRDLGRVGEASGGRISVPTPADAEAAAEHRRELEAAQLRIARLKETQADQAELLDGDSTDAADSDSPRPDVDEREVDEREVDERADDERVVDERVEKAPAGDSAVRDGEVGDVTVGDTAPERAGLDPDGHQARPRSGS